MSPTLSALMLNPFLQYLSKRIPRYSSPSDNNMFYFVEFVAGLYESGVPATWVQGDWNGDGVFNSGDFINAFVSGGYEGGPRPATAAIPEPNSLILLALGLLFLWRRR